MEFKKLLTFFGQFTVKQSGHYVRKKCCFEIPFLRLLILEGTFQPQEGAILLLLLLLKVIVLHRDSHNHPISILIVFFS